MQGPFLHQGCRAMKHSPLCTRWLEKKEQKFAIPVAGVRKVQEEKCLGPGRGQGTERPCFPSILPYSILPSTRYSREVWGRGHRLGQQPFSFKDQVESIPDFAVQMVFVTTAQLCCCSRKQSQTIHYECAWLCSS